MFKKALFSIPFILVFIILLISSFTKTIFAADFKITQNPYPVSIGDSSITITIETRDGSNFFVAPDYSAAAWKGNNLNTDHVCNRKIFKPFTGGNLTFTPNKATVSVDLSRLGNCLQIGDTWHLRLWAGKGWDAMNNPNNIIVADYPFTIVQTNGTLVTITAKNPDVYAGQYPIAILSSYVLGENYSFYWDGDRTIARHFPESGDRPGQLEIGFPNAPTNQPARRLCMLYGNYLAVPLWIDCNPSVSFNFKGNQPPPPISQGVKCTILPSTLPKNSQVYMKIDNVPPGMKVAAYALEVNSRQQFPTYRGTPDNTNSVVLNLIDKADNGSYEAIPYNEVDGKSICEPHPRFQVGNVAVVTPAACTTGLACALGGGKPCGNNDPKDPAFNPGFKTAIGCIHTKPVELVKDFLKFIVAISGGLAFLMMLLGAYQMLTSAGNPDSLNAGRERLTSAIIGLLFVIFAVLLMQIIGVSILCIPGFNQCT